MKRDTQNFKCEFAGELVSYIYAEMGERERALFEEHLPGCQCCIDLLAEISEARFAVYEWQRSEFALLETPVIRIPADSDIYARVSIFDRIRAVVSFMPAFAAGAVVIIVLMAALAVQFLDRGDDLASIANANSRTPETNRELQTRKDEPKDLEENQPEDLLSRGEIAADSVNSFNLKAGSKASRPERTSSRRRPSRPVQAASTPGSVPLQVAPRLSGIPDQEDEGLRLAELFDDIETLE